MAHGKLVITKIGETCGKRPALIPPETVCLFAVGNLKGLNTSLDVCDAVFGRKRNYF